MATPTLTLSPFMHSSFTSFLASPSLLALPLTLYGTQLHAASPVLLNHPSISSQTALNELLNVLNPRKPLYLLLRRPSSLVVVTFVPYLADQEEREKLLAYRHDLVTHLGAEHFSQSLICKEIGEITDVRSWAEREEGQDEACGDGCEDCDGGSGGGVKDLGYQRNKCRLCDRRMQNPISPEALAALKTPNQHGSLFVLTIEPSTLTIELTLSKTNIPPEEVSQHIPTTHPSYTFYHHPLSSPPSPSLLSSSSSPSSSNIFFIFHSPDSAPVKQRMTHTMGIPGLLVHAEDAGIHICKKLEIHSPSEVEFGVVEKCGGGKEEGEDGEEGGGNRDSGEEEGVRVGKYRSMYNRQGFRGTELVYGGMEGDRAFLDGVK